MSRTIPISDVNFNRLKSDVEEYRNSKRHYLTSAETAKSLYVSRGSIDKLYKDNPDLDLRIITKIAKGLNKPTQCYLNSEN